MLFFGVIYVDVCSHSDANGDLDVLCSTASIAIRSWRGVSKGENESLFIVCYPLP